MSPVTIQDVSGLHNLDSDDPLDVLRATLSDDDQGAEVIQFSLRRASAKR